MRKFKLIKWYEGEDKYCNSITIGEFETRKEADKAMEENIFATLPDSFMWENKGSYWDINASGEKAWTYEYDENYNPRRINLEIKDLIYSGTLRFTVDVDADFGEDVTLQDIIGMANWHFREYDDTTVELDTSDLSVETINGGGAKVELILDDGEILDITAR